MTTGRSFTGFLVSLIVALGAAATGLASSPAVTVDGHPAATAAESARPAGLTLNVEAAVVAPRVNRRVASRLRSKLESGFELAVQKLSHEPGCRDLFADLGADSLEMLSTTLYYQASLKLEKRVCPRAVGFTLVGGAPTWVCQRFAGLNDRRAARVLLHEALHHAGMDEWPHDPDGPTPAAIDELIEDACGF
jgi:hypothetical protein